MMYLVVTIVAVVMGAGIVVGLLWQLATGHPSLASFLLAPPWLLAWWWIGKGALRRRGNTSPTEERVTG
jgi:hypothetical protein